MRKITSKQQAILDYLQDKGWVGPTEIGLKVGLKQYASASAWPNRTLRILCGRKLIEENGKGQYCIKEG